MAKNVNTFFLFILCFLFQQNQFYAGVKEKWEKLSNPEKCWVLKHPFVAYKTMATTNYVISVTHEKNIIAALDNYENGGKLDAFRHIFWMSCITKKIGVRRALQLANAHEKGNYLQFKKSRLEEGQLPDQASSQMDSLNNIIGINIGFLWRKSNKSFDKDEIVKYINNGTAFIILRNEKGIFLDCNKHEIHIDSQKKQWKNQKCVVLLSTLKNAF
jgi:hypothetical protein